jgi:hypothetical protein
VALFLICTTLTLPTSKLALAMGVISTDYTGQKAAVINIKTVASSSGGKGSPTTSTSATTSAPRVGTIPSFKKSSIQRNNDKIKHENVCSLHSVGRYVSCRADIFFINANTTS